MLKGGHIMKKFTIIFSILLFLSFNMNAVTAIAQTKVFKQGLYNITDLSLSPNAIYSIQNVSVNSSVYILIFDANQIIQQSIRLKPQSSKYNLLPLEFGAIIVIVGDGEVVIS